MGLFSRDETVYVSSVIYPLGESPEKVPDIVKSAIITAGMTGSSRARAIDKAIFDGAGIKISQAYQYANRHYYLGMPQTTSPEQPDADETLLNTLCEEYLAAAYPPPDVVELKSASVEFIANVDTIVRQQIESTYNYDFFADAVHTAVGAVDVGATLEYEPLPIDDLLHEDEWGYRLTFTNPDTTTEVIEVWYPDTLFTTAGSVENRVLMEISINGAPATTISYADGGSSSRLNIYLRSLAANTSTTFPAIVIKRAVGKKKAVYIDDDLFTGTAWQTGAAYKTSKLYASRLGLDMDSLIDTVRGNENQKKIDYAFIQPGTFINSPNQAAIEYHFRYFHRLFLTVPDNKATYEAWVAANSWPAAGYVSKTRAKSCPAQSIRIKDPQDTTTMIDKTDSVDMAIAWRYMTYEVKSGTLSSKFAIECGAQEIVEARMIGGKKKKYDVTKLWLRQRLSDTEYAELCVVGLFHENYVYKGYKVQSAVWDMFNDPEGDFGTGFLIPLDYQIYVTLTARERLQLAQEALHMVFNCFKVVKEPWYATGIFKVILAIVAIVIIVVSWGSLSGPVLSLYSSVSAALGTVIASTTIIAAVAAVITAAILVGISMAISFVAKEAGEWAAEQWGPAWGAIVSIVTTVALSFGVGYLGGFNMMPTDLVQSVAMGASYIFQGLAVYTEFAMKELQEAQTSWNNYITGENNPLKEVNKLLETYFPEMGVIEEAAIFGPRERLDEFLARTLGLTDTLIYRLTMPIEALSEMTLTTNLR